MSRINTQSLLYDNYFKAICHKSVKHNYIYFYLSMTTCFSLQRPSSGHQYRTFKIGKIQCDYIHKIGSHLSYNSYYNVKMTVYNYTKTISKLSRLVVVTTTVCHFSLQLR